MRPLQVYEGKGRGMGMRRMMVVGVMTVLGWGVGLLAQETGKAKEEAEKKELSKAEVEKIITDGILEFRAGMVSEDEATRIKTLNRVLPDKEVMVKLFGKKDGELLWSVLKKGVEEMRKHTGEFKKEMEHSSGVKKIELINVREDDVSGRYGEVLGVIPKEVPVYRAVIDYEKGTAGSSSYLVVDGKFRWFQGLEMMPRVLRKKKEEEK